MIIAILVQVIITIAFLFLKKMKGKHSHIYSIFLLISTIWLSILLFIIGVAYSHGADIEALRKFSVIRTVKAINNSPIATKKDIDLPGNIIIYYRFGCKDCEAVYDELNERIEQNNNIYWVCTRSKLGKRLLQKYVVEEVPSGIIIQENNCYTQYILYNTIYVEPEREDDDYTIIDEEAFNRLLQLQQRIKESHKK